MQIKAPQRVVGIEKRRLFFFYYFLFYYFPCHYFYLKELNTLEQ